MSGLQASTAVSSNNESLEAYISSLSAEIEGVMSVAKSAVGWLKAILDDRLNFSSIHELYDYKNSAQVKLDGAGVAYEKALDAAEILMKSKVLQEYSQSHEILLKQLPALMTAAQPIPELQKAVEEKLNPMFAAYKKKFEMSADSEPAPQLVCG
jgi:hypothetical protein